MDALILYRRSPNLTALAKKELFRVPLLDLVFTPMGVLALHRGASEAHTQTPIIAKILIDQKTPLIIFAEGTRTVVGERRPLKSGAYYYQKEADLDVIVAAHNAGVCWSKKSWIKWPGKLIMEYSKPMPKNLSKVEFMEELERRRDGSSIADIWTAIVDRLNEQGCTLERPFPPDDEVRMD